MCELALAFTLALSAQPKPSKSFDHSCGYGDWVGPERLTPASSVLKDAHVTTAGGYTLVVGNHLVGLESESTLPDSVFRAFLHRHGSLGAPETAGRIVLSPVAALLTDGPMIAWGHATPEVRTGRQWLMANVSTVWAARYADEMWSTPRQLYEGLRIDWRRSANLLVDVSDRAHLLFIDDKLNPSILVHIIMSETSIVDSLTIGYGNSLTISKGRFGGLLAAYAGQDRETNTAGVYFTAWDGGSAWRKPELVMATRPGDAKDVLLVSSDSGLSLLWRDANGIRIMASRDEGGTWWLAREIHRRDINHLRGAIDSCGNTHMVYEDWAVKSPRRFDIES